MRSLAFLLPLSFLLIPPKQISAPLPSVALCSCLESFPNHSCAIKRAGGVWGGGCLLFDGRAAERPARSAAPLLPF